MTSTTTPFKATELLDHISLDCVIFGFHNNELKVLMLRLKNTNDYALPGGFVRYEETLEQAASRTLKERTGLDNIFLKQFKVFSEPDRNKSLQTKPVFDKNEPAENIAFFNKRFISVGFYALVEYSQVNPSPDMLSERCEWMNPFDELDIIFDHKKIMETALQTLRIQLNQQPIGLKLLPHKFTMPQLQTLYETLLGRKLDRRNFQRKILSYKILNKLNERKTGGAHKAPFLYEFNIESYQKALEEGLSGSW